MRTHLSCPMFYNLKIRWIVYIDVDFKKDKFFGELNAVWIHVEHVMLYYFLRHSVGSRQIFPLK